ncbi:MAG: hypothetical protein M5U26_23565 [Planctomycetota bacterium]|nr:hypothetical protein [Planctomycetota bacterium]
MHPPAPPPGPAYLLDVRKVTQTIETLCLRIDERFPGSGLGQVAAELLRISQETERTIAEIERPRYAWRVACGAFVAAATTALVFAVRQLEIDFKHLTVADLVQMSEAAINELVLMGAALVFLVSMETRAKRKKIIAAVNCLTSLAHVIDAHQLRKDPHRLAFPDSRTEHSPEMALNEFELGRYLDYCSELLALTGKVGFLYVQRFEDPVSAEVVNDLEQLTTGLERKIWQKIMILKKGL